MANKQRKKKLLERPVVATALSWLVIHYMYLCVRTSRIELELPEPSMPYYHGEKNALFAFWHGRMMVMPAFCPDTRAMHIMISRHGDGDLIAGAMQQFGFRSVRGSRSRGGSRAAYEAVMVLRGGDNLCITPDGPRGPREIAAPGVASIARLAGVPVLPVTFSASRYFRMKSWDRFVFILPFGRILFAMAAPIHAGDTNADDESVCQAVEDALNRITARADMQWQRA